MDKIIIISFILILLCMSFLVVTKNDSGDNDESFLTYSNRYPRGLKYSGNEYRGFKQRRAIGQKSSDEG